MLLQAYITGRLSGKRITYDVRFSSEQAYEGDTIHIIETLENRLFLPIVWLRSELVTSKWLDFAGPKSDVTHESRFVVSNFFLWGKQKITRKWFVKCLKRGMFTIDDVMLVWGDLFGLKEKAVTANVKAALTVYPLPSAIYRTKGMSDRMIGNIFTKRWINEDPFVNAGVREYYPSDPMNRIHWKATARTGNLMILKNDHTTYPAFIILVNVQSSDMDFRETTDKEEVEKLINAAAAHIDAAVRQNAEFAVISNGFNRMLPELKEEYRGIMAGGNGGNEERYRELAGIINAALIFGKGRKHAEMALRYLAGIDLDAAVGYEWLLEAVLGTGIAGTGRRIRQSDIVISLTAYKNARISELESAAAAAGRQVLP